MASGYRGCTVFFERERRELDESLAEKIDKRVVLFYNIIHVI